MNRGRGPRVRVSIVQFALHPMSGEMFVLDTRGNMWAGGRQSIDGKTIVSWERIGGLPMDYENEEGEDQGGGVSYIEPPTKSGGRHGG